MYNNNITTYNLKTKGTRGWITIGQNWGEIHEKRRKNKKKRNKEKTNQNENKKQKDNKSVPSTWNLYHKSGRLHYLRQRKTQQGPNRNAWLEKTAEIKKELVENLIRLVLPDWRQNNVFDWRQNRDRRNNGQEKERSLIQFFVSQLALLPVSLLIILWPLSELWKLLVCGFDPRGASLSYPHTRAPASKSRRKRTTSFLSCE